MVGSRAASHSGVAIARQLAAELSKAGVLVVSGLAQGIDYAAHAGALENGTIAVVAGGIDVIYPKENTALYEAKDQGRNCVVTASQPTRSASSATRSRI